MTRIFALLMLWLWMVPANSSAKEERRHWHADLGDGLEAALALQPPRRDGVRPGSFFWLFKTREISWTEDDEGFSIVFRKPWNEPEENPPGVRFLKQGDSLVMDPEALTEQERKSFGPIQWRPGGKAPHQLGDGRDRSSPYSKAHDRTRFVLDINTISVGLAEYALQVFDDDHGLLRGLVRHEGYSEETLIGIFNNAIRPVRTTNDKSRQGGVLTALAMNSSTPKAILDQMWAMEDDEWMMVAPYLLSIHPKADPEWGREIRARIKTEKGARLRSGLAFYYPLPGEMLDVLIENAGLQYSIASHLASRKDLTDAQMVRLMKLHPWTAGKELLKREDLPIDAFLELMKLEPPSLLAEILENPKTPEAVARFAIEKILSDPKLHHGSSFVHRLSTAASHPLLTESEQRALVDHLAIEVRRALAENPSLVMEFAKRLARDQFAVVAGPSRTRLDGEIDDLVPLEKLKGARTTMQARNQALVKDDADQVAVLNAALVGSYSTTSPVELAVKAKAIRSLRRMINEGQWTRVSLADQAAKPGWNESLADLALGEHPDPEVVGAMAHSVSRFGKADDLLPLEKRGVSLEKVEHPLIWWAVARREAALVERLLKLGAQADIRENGSTPAQLAVRSRFVEATRLLPLDEEARTELADFQKRFPGDPNAAWLGGWTNGKGEFKTVNVHFNADGTGTIVGAVGAGAAIAWKKGKEGEFILYAFGDGGQLREAEVGTGVVLDDGALELTLGERIQRFKSIE